MSSASMMIMTPTHGISRVRQAVCVLFAAFNSIFASNAVTVYGSLGGAIWLSACQAYVSCFVRSHESPSLTVLLHAPADYVDVMICCVLTRASTSTASAISANRWRSWRHGGLAGHSEQQKPCLYSIHLCRIQLACIITKHPLQNLCL